MPNNMKIVTADENLNEGKFCESYPDNVICSWYAHPFNEFSIMERIIRYHCKHKYFAYSVLTLSSTSIKKKISTLGYKEKMLLYWLVKKIRLF